MPCPLTLGRQEGRTAGIVRHVGCCFSRRRGWLHTQIVIALALAILWPWAAQATVHGSPFYDFKVVARRDTPVNSTSDTFPLGDILRSVSVNDRGRVAFCGEVRGAMHPGSVLVVDNPSAGALHWLNDPELRSDLTALVQFYWPQINNDNRVIVTQAGALPWHIEVFNADQPGGVGGEESADYEVYQLPWWVPGWETGCYLPHVASRAEDGFVAYNINRREQSCMRDPFTKFLFFHLPGQRMEFVNLRELPPQLEFGSPPMIANGGVIVFRDGVETDGAVMRFSYDTLELRTLAATSEGWQRLSDPAITSDGTVAAFVGEIGGIKGIYLRVFDPSAASLTNNILVLGSDTPIAFDDGGQPITLSSFDDHFLTPGQTTPRIGIIRQNIGSHADIVGDSIILTFIATPSSADRMNPAAPSKPLLFSSEKGVWTVRIDVQRELAGSRNVVLNPHGVLPVIQVGDTAYGATITDLHLWDALSEATVEPDGSARRTLGGLPSPGDHYLAFWIDTTAGPMVVKGAKLDTDEDGLLDHWERPGGGIDMDRDSQVDLDLSLWNANVRRKDLFLEIDWVRDRTSGYIVPWKNTPAPEVVQFLTDMFYFAPVLNPDGSMGIDLHVDAGPGTYPVIPFSYSHNTGTGNLQGGDRVAEPGSGGHLDLVYFGLPGSFSIPGVVSRSFHDIKETFFGTGDKRARELAFRYCVFADFYDVLRDAAGNPILGNVQTATLRTLAPAVPPPVFNGGAILITAGRGASQLRRIVASTSTPALLQMNAPWQIIPDSSSRFVLLNTSAGVGEIFFRPAENHHSLTGNDMMVTLGGWGVDLDGYLRGTEEQWRTLAHELGHTLGLRHGGTNHCEYSGHHYASLMNYSHMDRLSPMDDLTNGCIVPYYNFVSVAGAPVFPVASSYAGGTDPTFNDWAYIQMATYHHLPNLGNSFEIDEGVQVPETFTVEDFEALFGDTDRQAPVITLLAPPPAASLPLGEELGVRLNVRDESPVGPVRVWFDVDGNGAITDPEDAVFAENAGGSEFTAAFSPASGPVGARTMFVAASDIVGNTARSTYSVWVGPGSATDENPPLVVINSPTVGSRISTEAWLVARITALDNSEISAVVVDFDSDGDGTYETVTAGEIDSSQYQAIFRSISGPAGARWLEVRATDRWLNSASNRIQLSILPAENNPPVVEIHGPVEGADVGLSTALAVSGRATEDVALTNLTVSFDVDGDGAVSPLETMAVIPFADGTFGTTFSGAGFPPAGLTGPEGSRAITVEALDWTGNRSVSRRTVNVRDLLAPSVLFSSPLAGAAVRLGAAFAVDLKVRDDQRVDGVLVSFDLNGDGTASGAEEVVMATALGGENFRASFGNVTGVDGTRVITATARDPTTKVATVRQVVHVAVAAVVQRPVSNEVVNPSSTFHVQVEIVPGLSISQVSVAFDIDGDGSRDGPGERVQASAGDEARQYLAAFSNIGGPPGPRSISVELTDPAGTTTNSPVQTVEVGSFDGFPGAVSRKLAAVPFLPEAASAAPENFTAAGPYLFFNANDQIVGRELWRTDGTPEGTVLLRDVNPDKAQSGAAAGQPLGAAIEYLTAFVDQVFFAASDWHGESLSSFQPAAFGRELWRSDGTMEGTVMVKDIYAGRDDSTPEFLTVFQGRLLFAAYDEANGSELWQSDGTESGTILFKDINPGRLGSSPENLAVVGGTLYFAANLSQLWKSDGTTEGTRMVKDIYPGGGASGTPEQLTAADGRLFFTANDGTNGWELWTSDGTESGTVMVHDIYPGPRNGSYPESLTAFNGALYFTATNTEFGRELWKSDGTEAGTALPCDIWPGMNSSLPSDLVEFEGRLFFSANDGANGRELWKTDGTTDGTVLAVNLASYSGPPPTDSRMIYPTRSSSPAFLTVYHGMLYFRADDGTGSHGPELWKSDGTQEGTLLVRDIAPGRTRPIPTQPSYLEPMASRPGPFHVFNDELYFNASDEQYRFELWKTDGTSSGTRRVRNSARGAAPPIAAAGSALYHQGSDGVHGTELWQSTSNGAAMLKDLNPGVSNSFPARLKLVNGQLVFSASNGLWTTDGTAAGTARLHAFNDLPAAGFEWVELNDTLFFSAAGPDGLELWKTDASAPGTMLVKDIRVGSQGSAPAYPEVLAGQILFQASDGVAGKELWRTDGTSAGTLMISNINAGAADSNPGKLTAYSGAIMFAATGGSRGYELWRTDGTTAGTVLVKDIRPGSSSSFDSSVLNLSQSFVSFNGQLFFSANDGVNGYELWKTDGTLAGTLLVKDIKDTAPGQDSRPENWTIVRDTLFFSADSRDSIELWKTDGTTPGTVLVKNIRGRHPTLAFEQASSPQNLVELNGALLFTAVADNYGRELWRSDGTTFGTVMLKDIFPGQRSSDIRQLTVVRDRLFFIANDGAHGHELWTSDGTFDGTHFVEDLLPGPGSANPSSLSNTNDSLYYFADDGADDLSLRALDLVGASSFRRWLDSVATLSGSDAQLGADPDGDGLSNVVEHDLGSAPDDPLSRGPVIRGVSVFLQDSWTYLDLAYTRRENAIAHGLRFWAEHSRNLSGWLLMQTVGETVTAIDDNLDYVTVRVRIPAVQSGFARLVVGTSP